MVSQILSKVFSGVFNDLPCFELFLFGFPMIFDGFSCLAAKPNWLLGLLSAAALHGMRSRWRRDKVPAKSAPEDEGFGGVLSKTFWSYVFLG